MDAHAIDLLDELQLRRWARMNYLPPHKRARLHLVVQAEMETMDYETSSSSAAALAAEHQNRRHVCESTAGSRFVPLADSPYRRLDLAHELPARPNFLTRTGKRSTTRFADAETSHL